MQSEITFTCAVQRVQDFLPVKILFNGIVLYDDWDFDEPHTPTIDVLSQRLWQIDRYIVDEINIKMVDFHHSIVSMQGHIEEVKE